MFGRILSRVSTLTLLFVCTAVFAFGQDLDDVTIAGKITDSNGLAIVGASVTATSVETGVQRTVVTDDDGRYQIVKLKPGTYKVKAVLSGFGAQETPGIVTVSAQNLIKDFRLSPADVRAGATVTVTEDDGPVVDTTRITVGGTITGREIEEIPNNSRNALDLVLTLGGTSEEQLSTSGLAEDRLQAPSGAPLEQGNFSISGGTAYSNNITIDGLDNNDDRSSRDRFQPSIESIAEVQVIANQFSAEYGRAAGGRVNIRTRAGGNQFRGRAFMFFRDESLNANSWYNNSRNIRRPPLQQIDPGFTLSGPVVLPFGIFNGRNRTFFSFAYERDMLADTTLIDANVPVTPNPRYPLPPPTGSTFCDVAGTPAPPCPAGVATVGRYVRLYDTPNLSNVVTARIDTKLFKDNDFTFGLQFGRKSNKRTTGATVNRLENALQAKNINTEAYNFTDNHVFGAKAVNQLRAQWSSYRPSFEAPDPFNPVLIITVRDPLVGTESLVLGNSTAGSGSNFPDTRNETRWQVQDSFTYIKGNHTFKTGFDYQSVISKVTGLGDATGTFSFASAFAFSESQLSRYLQNFGTAQDTRNKYMGFYFNDQFRVGSNVTMSAGVRYEKETAVNDNNNFGPRVGVSWDPFKSGRGVIRFGAGIFYNRVLLRTVGESIQNTLGSLVNFSTATIGTGATDSRRVAILAALSTRFPNTYASIADLRALVTATCATVIAPPAPCTPNTGFTIGGISAGGTPIRSVDTDLKIPESYQFNVGFERELFKGWVFEANYTWNKTVHLWRDKNANAPRLPAGFADFTAWLQANTFALMNQNGTTRTYSFVLGSTTDTSGVGPCAVDTNNNCVVNLNSTNTTVTAPAAASTGNNFNAVGTPIGIATAAVGRFRPDATLDEASRIGSLGNAFYQGLILELRSRYRKLGGGFGASFRMAYTLSKTMDDGLNNTANAEVNGDFSRDWARNLQDRRHRFALSGTFDAPRWLGSLKFSPLFRAGTSAPFNLGAGGTDRNLDDLGTDRINFSGNLQDIQWRRPGSPIPTTLLSQFSLQPIGSRGGNLPRNAGTGPSFYTFDLSVTREFKFSEKMRLRPVLEFGNILNAAVFSYGSAFINFGVTATAQTAFLVPTRTYRQRDIRLGMRFDF